jgi:hypothetical protein
MRARGRSGPTLGFSMAGASRNVSRHLSVFTCLEDYGAKLAVLV